VTELTRNVAVKVYCHLRPLRLDNPSVQDAALFSTV